MDRFEKYLKQKKHFIEELLTIFEGSQEASNKEAIKIMLANQELIDDIIHHFKLFVKGDEDD